MEVLKVMLVTLVLSSNIEAQKIVYKFSNDYERIWDDTGSGSKVDVSLWKLNSLESGFYPLGDIAVMLHNQPTFYSILVKDTENLLVQPPIQYTEIWDDTGSGAPRDVTIYSLQAQEGFTCLGHVAVASYSQPPDLSAYRCIKTTHLTQGRVSFIWNDAGSGAVHDVSLWKVENDPMLSGIAPFTFLSQASHDPLVVVPLVLDAQMSIPSSFIPIPADVALIMYDTQDMNEMWNDHGSRGDYSLSIWRPTGCCTLGDVAVATYAKPTGVLLREAVEGTLRKPTSFEKVWDDAGSGATLNVAIWKPICPAYYLPLGYVSTSSYVDEPSVESTRCVNVSLVTPGDWEWVYDDKNTGSARDVTVWRAVPSGAGGQSAMTFKAVARHGPMDLDAYVLRPDAVSVRTGSPPVKVNIADFRYDFVSQEVTSANPIELTTKTTADNCKAPVGSPPINVKRTLTVTTTYESSWTVESTLAVGVEMTFTTGIPLIAQNEVSVSSEYTQSWEKTVTDTKSVTDTLEASINVNAGQSVTFYVTGERYIGNVPWTATMTTTFEDGASNEGEVSGMYSGVQVAEIRVTADAPIDC